MRIDVVIDHYSSFPIYIVGAHSVRPIHIKLSVVWEHTVLPYEIRLHIRLTCGRPGTCQNI